MTVRAIHIPEGQDRPLGLVRLARGVLAAGRRIEARELAAQALAQAPDSGEVRALAAEVMSAGVPGWHFSIIRDATRNAAYDAALRRAVRPGMKVLEIGAGTGLLSMMAARAGARVVACEADPAMAEVARENIARNGYADRIEVIAKRSTELDAEADLGGRADLLVAEIVSNEIVGESALSAKAHAASELLAPGAPMIPASAVARVALAHSPKIDDRRVGLVDGFDLGALNQLAWPSVQLKVGDQSLALASEPGDLFEFEFGAPGQPQAGAGSVVLTASGAPANCLVQWLELRMDSQGRYENLPCLGADSCWAVLAHPLRAAISPAAGEQITVMGAYTDERMQVWVEGY